MIHFVLIIGLFVLVVAVTMLVAGSDGAQRALDRGARPDRRLRLRGLTSVAGRAGAGAGLSRATRRRQHLDRPLARPALQPTAWQGLSLAAHCGRHVHHDTGATPRHAVSRRARRHVPLDLARGSRRRLDPAPRRRNDRCRRCRLGAPDVHRQLPGEEAARPGRARPSRLDRPPRRDARGRPELPAVAPSRSDQGARAARLRGSPDPAGAEHGPDARRGAREPPRPHRHARGCGCSRARSPRARRWASPRVRSCATSRSRCGSVSAPMPRSAPRRRR